MHAYEPVKPIIHILKRPRYALLFAGTTVLVNMVLVWFFNLELIIHVIGNTSLDTGEKTTFFFRTVASIYSDMFTSLRSFLFVAFSLVFGLNITTLVFLRQQRVSSKTPKSSFAVALIGSGCVACGGSIVAPVLTLAGATASLALSYFINIIAFVAAVALGFYSLYKLFTRNKEVVTSI